MQSNESRTPVFKAGAAQVDITPAAGIPLTGFIAREGPSTGIHDRIFARALALEIESQRVILIACDLLALDAPYVAAARAAIHDATGILEDHILISCTHTHSGPATIPLRDCGEVDAAYLTHLKSRLVTAAQETLTGLRRARVGSGCGQVKKGTLNRRQPGTPVDSDLSLVAIQDLAGQTLAVLANFTCHPVCLDHTNRLVSADYPGVWSRIIQEKTQAIGLFTNGAAGDINPEKMGRFEYAEELGSALAAETLRLLEHIEFHEPRSLAVANEWLNLPLNPHPTAEALSKEIASRRLLLSAAKDAGDDQLCKIHTALLGWAATTLADMNNQQAPASMPAEIQVIHLGEIVLVGIPGEIFSELGKQIKNLDPSRQVMVLGYTNNDIGYIPTHQAYETGGYEVEEAFKFYGYPAALAPEAGDHIISAAARLLDHSLGRNEFASY